MKKVFKTISVILILMMSFPVSVLASEYHYEISDLIGAEQSEFEPEYSEEKFY